MSHPAYELTCLKEDGGGEGLGVVWNYSCNRYIVDTVSAVTVIVTVTLQVVGRIYIYIQPSIHRLTYERVTLPLLRLLLPWGRQNAFPFEVTTSAMF